MKSIRWGFATLALLALAGCFETLTLVRLNKDGSGTVEERVVISNRFVDMVWNLGGMGEHAGPPPEETVLVDREKLRQHASQMGEGVELASAEPLRTDWGAGYLALHRFSDINALRLSSNPGDSIALPNLREAGQEEGAGRRYITFRFTPGATAALDILLPPPGPASSPKSKQEPPEEDEMQMMRQFFQDMRIQLAVEVNGKILDTDASYREGSRVTLVDLDFGRLVQDEALFRKVAAAQPTTLEDMKSLVSGVPFLKVELKDSLSVRFR